jgi:hypothetical protein
LEPDAVDPVFALPWPDEERVTAGLFEHHAAAVAVLLTFRGAREFHLWDHSRLHAKTASRG